MLRRSCLLILTLTAAPAARAGADTRHLDAGRYTVSLAGHAIGTEEFAFDVVGDSLIVTARSHQSLPARAPGGGPLVIDKAMTLVSDAFDFGLRRYMSSQASGPDTLLRGVEPAGGDTLFSVFRQDGTHGEGDRRVLPPGRLYVVDSPPLFTAFGLICHTLHGKSFDTRPIAVLVLGPRDTLLEASVSDLGHETIRWGARPVSARKLRISDASTEFLAWVSPAGHMLRLEQPSTHLKVERAAAAVRRPVRRRAG
jgi:hypothetical protein